MFVLLLFVLELLWPINPIPTLPQFSQIPLPAKTTRSPTCYTISDLTDFFGQIYPLFNLGFRYLAWARHGKGSWVYKGLVVKPQHVYDIRDTIFSSRGEDMVARRETLLPSYKIKEGSLEEFTTGRRSERIRKLLKPQELTSIHVLPPDGCSWRLGPFPERPEWPFPLHHFRNSGIISGSWSLWHSLAIPSSWWGID